MDLIEVIQSRRTIHEYANKPVDEAIVQEALKLSLFAPNHKLTFPWRYYKLEGESRNRFEQAIVDYKNKNSEEAFSMTKIQAMKQKLSAASHMIVLAKKRHENKTLETEDYGTIACSIQIASMYLWSLGIGSKWSSGSYTKMDTAYSITGCLKSQEEILGVFWIGYPARVPEYQQRPPLSEILVRVP